MIGRHYDGKIHPLGDTSSSTRLRLSNFSSQQWLKIERYGEEAGTHTGQTAAEERVTNDASRCALRRTSQLSVFR